MPAQVLARPDSFLSFRMKDYVIEHYYMEGWTGSRLDNVSAFETLLQLGELGYKYHSQEIDESKGEVTIYFVPPARHEGSKRPPMFKSERF